MPANIIEDGAIIAIYAVIDYPRVIKLLGFHILLLHLFRNSAIQALNILLDQSVQCYEAGLALANGRRHLR